MKRSGLILVAALLVFCGILPWWGGAAQSLVPIIKAVLAVPALLCNVMIPDGPLLLGVAVAVASLLGVTLWSALRLAARSRLTVDQLRAAGEETEPSGLRRLAERAGVAGRLDLVTDHRIFAFTCGFVRPRIIVSRGLIERLDEEELEAVLRHESAHLRRNDPLRVLIARSLSAAFALVPFTRAALQTYLCDLELAADRATVRAMGDVLPLASALHRTILSGSAPPELAVASVNDRSAIDVRIDRLLGLDTPSRLAAPRISQGQVAAFTLSVATALCMVVGSSTTLATAGLCVGCWPSN